MPIIIELTSALCAGTGSLVVDDPIALRVAIRKQTVALDHLFAALDVVSRTLLLGRVASTNWDSDNGRMAGNSLSGKIQTGETPTGYRVGLRSRCRA